MQTFDQPFAQDVITRLGGVPETAKPQWGTMNRGQLIGHLNNVVVYTLGQGPEVPFRGSLKSRYLFRHVILLGLKPIPHNVRAVRPKGMTETEMFPELPLAKLEATVATYLARADEGDLPPRTHPYFGILSGPQWQRFHRLHFTHHLQQFGAGEGL